MNAINPGMGVTGVNVTRGAGLTPASSSFSINSSGWDDLAANDYYQFGFTTTKQYDVQTLTVGLRSSATGPGFINLLYSKDGGSFMTLASVSPIPLSGTDYNNLSADLSPIGLVNSSLIFRLMVDPNNAVSANGGAIGSAGTFRFASYSPSGGVFLNPEITGQAVPEPSTVLLLGLGMLPVAGGVWMRRRARTAA